MGRLVAATTLLLVVACGASEDDPAVFQTLPEVVPTATADEVVPASPDAAATREASEPTASSAPSTTPSPPPSPTSPAADGQPVAPSDPADIARELGLDGMIDLIGQDPEAAGERGEDLLHELERVRDKPDRKRIERALDRLREWDDDGDIHPEVADAARVVLTEIQPRNDDDTDDEDDDDDD
ncbi:hypothetical protein [Euzebya rosea]|uniref:hypothetical protein n=1 Tax=Euzebya rosea TaxID=2052804 RepID=UPI00130039FC|nr:hypothetical protein [Euzebya rosea]